MLLSAYVAFAILNYHGRVQLLDTRGSLRHLLLALLQRRVVTRQRRLLRFQCRPQRRQIRLARRKGLVGLRQRLLRRLRLAAQRSLLTLRLDQLVVESGLLRPRSLRKREHTTLLPVQRRGVRRYPPCAAAGRRACA